MTFKLVFFIILTIVLVLIGIPAAFIVFGIGGAATYDYLNVHGFINWWDKKKEPDIVASGATLDKDLNKAAPNEIITAKESIGKSSTYTKDPHSRI